MKRGGPLQRRAPLAGKSNLARSAPLARTGRLPARSAKREAVMVERRQLVAEILATRPVCEARLSGCTRRSVDVHERKSRARGGDILDRRILVALCRWCHTWITEHPAEAERLGWALPSWWKGNDDA